MTTQLRSGEHLSMLEPHDCAQDGHRWRKVRSADGRDGLTVVEYRCAECGKVEVD